MDLESIAGRIVLGRGKSGIVFLENINSQKPAAVKVFTGHTLADAVNYLFLGAPNPYGWNEDAVLCAFYRRKILEELAPIWTGQRLSVAQGLSLGWNAEFKAYQLEAEFINGLHAGLHHPLSGQRDGELSDLVDNIMLPLQEGLISSGFDGALWQAGKGNPTATGNFLLIKNTSFGNDGDKWVWIDIESGVSPLLPLSPKSFLFYLKKSRQHGTPLFDDVDMDKLRAYVATREDYLIQHIGSQRYVQLVENVDKLGTYQRAWKSLGRTERAISSQLNKGRISKEQAERYSRLPYLWYGKEIARGLAHSIGKLSDLPWEVFNKVTLVDYNTIISNMGRFVFSEENNSKAVQGFFKKRVEEWSERKQLSGAQAGYYFEQIDGQKTTPYFKDLMINASIKPIEHFVVPFAAAFMYIKGVLSSGESAAFVFFGGSAIRTLYTGFRMFCDNLGPSKDVETLSKIWNFAVDGFNMSIYLGPYDALKYGARKILDTERVIALICGIVPTAGNLAYPIQMMHSSSPSDREIGKFMLYYYFSKIGQNFPIIGGKDTRIEHLFNSIPDLIVRDRTSVYAKTQSSQ